MARNLYPPIIENAMPSFVNSTPCEIYFSISSLNNIDDISGLQLSAVYLTSNRTALAAGDLIAYSKSNFIGPDDKGLYKILLAPGSISGGFQINTFYKIQLRFISTGAPSTTSVNLDNLSEWSTVCLLRPISKPSVSVSSYSSTLVSRTLTFRGRIDFGSNEKEYLYSYQLNLFEGDHLLESSDILFPLVNSKEFDYSFEYLMESGHSYKAEFTYQTNGGYRETLQYPFTVSVSPNSILNSITISPSGKPDVGAIVVNLSSNLIIPTTEVLAIKRSSSLTGFKKWETVHNVNNERIARNRVVQKDGKTIEYSGYSWVDLTAASGVWYKYAVASVKDNALFNLKINDYPFMIDMDDAYLVSGNRQLAIKLNPNVTVSYTNQINTINTLGGKYPIVTKNNGANYRQLQISGLIASEGDSYGLFTTKPELYKESLNLYEQYNNPSADSKKQAIMPWNDFIYEKFFRDEVIKFLYDGEVKLFKSTQEGNILAKVTNVTFTPNQTLGRRLWSFNATLVEIDDFNEKNCVKYNVQSLDHIDEIYHDIENVTTSINNVTFVDGNLKGY